MTGYEFEEVVGRNPKFLQGPLTEGSVLNELRKALFNQTFFCGTTKNYRKDGSTYDVEWNINPVLNANGQLVQFISLQQEIIPDDNAQRQLKKLGSDLINERESQLRTLAIIGHELKTPLTVIKMLQDDMKLSDMSAEGKDLCRATDSVINILENLRIAMQPELSINIKKVPASPFEVVEQSINSLSSFSLLRNLNVHLSGNTESAQSCFLEARILNQIIIHLVKNAAIHAKATDLWVEINGQIIDKTSISLRITVEDNGQGIHGKALLQLFDAFNRGDSDADGTGLGLYIVKELLNTLGGTIRYFESTHGGAGISLSFTVESSDTKESTAHQPEPEQSLDGMRVLFAEDQLMIQLLTSKVLGKQGANVIVANDGVEALKIFNEDDNFDLIITDLNMPNMNGVDLTRALRERGYTGHILGVTAVMGNDYKRLLVAGADNVLPKPIDVKDIKRLVWRFNNA